MSFFLAIACVPDVIVFPGDGLGGDSPASDGSSAEATPVTLPPGAEGSRPEPPTRCGEAAAFIGDVPYASIAAAASSAVAGETIVVCEGTWNEVGVVIGAPGVTLRGEEGSYPTLDGRGKGPGIWVEADEITLQGLRLVRYAGEQGGAIAAGDGTLTLVDLDLQSNVASDQGGAIAKSGGRLVVIGCLFEGNSAETGGAIALMGSALEVVDSTFSENLAYRSGGAWVVQDVDGLGLDLQVRDVRFLDNEAGGGGAIGALAEGELHLAVEGGSFEENTSVTTGGAIELVADFGLVVDLARTTFSKNVGAASGGALRLESGQLQLTAESVLFTANRSSASGGAIDVDLVGEFGLGLSFLDVTFEHNVADLRGSAIEVLGSAKGSGRMSFTGAGVRYNGGESACAIETIGEIVVSSDTSDWGTGDDDNAICDLRMDEVPWQFDGVSSFVCDVGSGCE